MEHQLWKEILAVIKAIGKSRRNPRCRFSCEEIVLVWFWSVLHDRPVSWACDRRNWPLHQRRRRLPSSSTMSRRLRSPDVQTLIKTIEDRTLCSKGTKPLAWMIDGKPLVISGCSKDRQAGFGRAAQGKAKGYKLHSIVGMDGSIAGWRIAPMNKDERIMARRLLRDAGTAGWVERSETHETWRKQERVGLTPFDPPYGFRLSATGTIEPPMVSAIGRPTGARRSANCRRRRVPCST